MASVQALPVAKEIARKANPFINVDAEPVPTFGNPFKHDAFDALRPEEFLGAAQYSNFSALDINVPKNNGSISLNQLVKSA
jgi:hypothetical protein